MTRQIILPLFLFVIFYFFILGPAFSYRPLIPLGKYDLSGRFSFGIDTGIYGPDSMSGNGKYIDTEVQWGGNLKYFFNNNFGLGLKYHLWDHSDSFHNNGAGFYNNPAASAGDKDFDEYGRGDYNLELSNMDITLYYYFDNITSPKVTPFIGAGASHFSADYRYHGSNLPGISNLVPGNVNTAGQPFWESLSLAPGGIGANDWKDFSLSQSEWGFHFTGGMDYMINPDFSTRFEFKYVSSEMSINMAPDLVGTTAGSRVSDSEILDLSGFCFNLGFNYFFSAPGSNHDYDESYYDNAY
jgi:outer membrane protein W